MTGSAFIDRAIEQRFAADGFVLLPTRLGRDALERLRSLYVHTVVDGPSGRPTGGFFPSASIIDSEIRAEIWDVIVEVVRAALDPGGHPAGMHVAGGSFAVNPPGGRGGRDPHQDPTVVDESKFANLSLWIPLVDVDDRNGALSVLPRSHLATNNIRPVGVQSLDATMTDAYWAGAETLPMRAGEILALDGKLVHGSGPNRTDSERVAVISGILPVGPMRYARATGNGRTTDVYAVTPDFFRSANLLQPDLAAYELIGQVDYRLATWPVSETPSRTGPARRS